MRKQATLIFCFAFVLTGSAQVFLERQVVASFGLDSTLPGMRIQSTVGQPEYLTMESDSFMLTQGFQQSLHYAVPNLTFEFVQDECTGEILATITNISGCTDTLAASVLWDDDEGLLLLVTSADTVELDIYGPPGCHYENTIVFANESLISEPCEYDFYQLITPNGDGSNDGWMLDQLGLPGFETANVTIFNRWGVEVWSAEKYDNHNVLWTGHSNKGSDLPDGTYFYLVETEVRAYTGFVELQR